MSDRATITVALLGNPNTGKSTLFSAMVGVPQRIGNYPGVTVEKKVGDCVFAGHHFSVIDLPGTYSLAPRSPDEMVAVDVLLGRRGDVPPPDVIVCIVDATNIWRNLYLVSQAMELERPVVVVLNKIDLAQQRGITIDAMGLRQRLGVPVIETQAHRGVGLVEFRQALLDAATGGGIPMESPFPDAFCEEVARLKTRADARRPVPMARYLVERLLLDTGGYLERSDLVGGDRELFEEVRLARKRLQDAGYPIPGIETTSRYQWVERMIDGLVAESEDQPATMTDHIDRVVTHKLAGTLIFFGLMAIVFQSMFAWAVPFQAWIEQLVGAVGEMAEGVIPGGVLQSLVADGVVAGVGAVLVFLPPIAMLFFFVALLEDCGYMARAAYLMDGLMQRVGLSGKSFIPLLSSFACAVPGIMATRVIEDRRDRLVTILVAPLMSCSARLPVYILLIAAFIPDRRFLGGWIGLQGGTMMALYLLGIVVAIAVALILRRTILKGETPPFVMELPDFRFPSLRTVAARVTEQCWAFLHDAGTLILAVTVIIWAMGYFPRPAHLEEEVRARFAGEVAQLESLRGSLSAGPTDGMNAANHEAARGELDERQAELEARIANHVAGAYMEQSMLGRLGKLVAPLVRPLGWDWRIGCAVIASFPAREVVIGAMGVIYNLGEGQDEESSTLRQTLAAQTWPETGEPIFTIPVALSILVFFALCAQCAATLVIIRKETGSRWWPVFTFGYMTLLAYVGALVTYQGGTWLGL